MAAMELDAKERATDKKRRMKIAMELKDEGNQEFKQGNFEKALEFYDKVLCTNVCIGYWFLVNQCKVKTSYFDRI